MALIGLVRVSTQTQETRRQHDRLDPICTQVFDEKVSGKLSVDKRPGLSAALAALQPGDKLCVLEVDRLGRSLLDGLIVLNDLFERGVTVKVLEGIAAGEHCERSLILDLALALAEDRRRDISAKTKSGLQAARAHGKKLGRPTVIDENVRRLVHSYHQEGWSVRRIAEQVGVSRGTVSNVLRLE